MDFAYSMGWPADSLLAKSHIEAIAWVTQRGFRSGLQLPCTLFVIRVQLHRGRKPFFDVSALRNWSIERDDFVTAQRLRA